MYHFKLKFLRNESPLKYCAVDKKKRSKKILRSRYISK